MSEPTSIPPPAAEPDWKDGVRKALASGGLKEARIALTARDLAYQAYLKGNREHPGSDLDVKEEVIAPFLEEAKELVDRASR